MTGSLLGRGRGVLGLALVALTVARLGLVRGQSITALGHALHDDRLFLRIAGALRSGDWLGPYDQLTLVKGPFYPAWIAGVYRVGLPLLQAEQLLYLAACVTLAVALRPLLPRTVLVLTYCVLLFNPTSYADQVMTRVAREAVYPALTTLVAACALGLLARRERSLAVFAGWSAGLGIALAAFWLTREEGVWLIPSVLLLLGTSALGIWRARPRDYPWRLSLCLLPLAVWLAVTGAVAARNDTHYGVFATVEMRSPAFLAAYGSLARVEHGTEDPRVPVPRETRARIYAVSPAFAELKPFLDGDLGRGWTAPSCRVLSVCGDIGGGWFVWALRDAAAAAGHHASGQAAESYYRNLAREVNAACARGELRCRAVRATLAPPWRSEYARPLSSTLARGLLALTRFEGFDPVPSPSVGPRDWLKPFYEHTHGRVSPRYLIQGWAVTPGGPTALDLSRRDGERVVSYVDRIPSPDVSRRFRSSGAALPEAAFARFEISTTCRRGCELQVASGEDVVRRIPLDGSVHSIASPRLYLTLEHLGYEEPAFETQADSTMLEWLGYVGAVYGFVVPPVALLAFVAHAIEALRGARMRVLSRAWWVRSALLLAILVRLALLSLVHVTSFPVMSLGHLAPAHPLLLAFSAVTLATWSGGARRRHGPSKSPVSGRQPAPPGP